MRINLSKDYKEILITFEYNQEIVIAIRSIPGRKYDPIRKSWTVPVANAVECLNTLLPIGFTANVDVKAIARKKQVELDKIEEIKKGNAEVMKDFGLPLYNFQKVGANFMSNVPNALLADVPGLGKTIQTIASLQDCKKILVLCPASLKFGWADEIDKWATKKENIIVINGNKKEREVGWLLYQTKWYIANYELLLHDYDEMKNIEWDAIVCDEATRISNPNAKSVKALKTIPAKKRLALTGTPVSNSPTDLFSIIDWIAPGFLGTFYSFRSRYCIMESSVNRRQKRSYQRIVGYRNMDELSDKIARFMLRRTKEEVLDDFPKKTVQDLVFSLSDDEQEFYDEVRTNMIEEVDKLKISTSSLSTIMVKMLRLKQATGHPCLLTEKPIESSKLMLLRDNLQKIVANGDKAIVFTQFATMAKILNTELAEYMPKLIYGDVPAEDRKIAVDEFNENDEHKVMIMTEAGAYGLNLQSASYVFHYDLPWSVSKMMQREDRSHRIGQKKPVTVYNLIAKDTIDEYVAKVLHAKQKTSVKLLKDFERMEATGMSIDDIKSILRI